MCLAVQRFFPPYPPPPSPSSSSLAINYLYIYIYKYASRVCVCACILYVASLVIVAAAVASYMINKKKKRKRRTRGVTLAAGPSSLVYFILSFFFFFNFVVGISFTAIIALLWSIGYIFGYSRRRLSVSFCKSIIRCVCARCERYREQRRENHEQMLRMDIRSYVYLCV